MNMENMQSAGKYKLAEKHEYAFLIIGDEILSGSVVEANLLPLVSALSKKGYSLSEVRIVGDVIDDISEALTQLKRRYSFVVTSGGIGPTHDDRTFEGIAKAFDVDIAINSDMFEYFMRTPRTKESQIKAVQRMSSLPIGTELILLDETWPIIKKENCYIMAGLPSVCHQTIKKLYDILPEQNKNFRASWNLKAKEHEFFQWLNDISQKYQDGITVGSYPLDKDSPLKKEGVLTQISLNSNAYEEGKKCYHDILEYLEKNDFLISYVEYHHV